MPIVPHRYRRPVTAVALAAALAAAVPARAADDWRVFPRLHASGHWSFFANHADAFSKVRYNTYGELAAALSFLSYRGRTHLVGYIRTATGMGMATVSGLPFAVHEVAYTLAPYLEYNGDRWIGRAGLDHGCDHLILSENGTAWYTVDGERAIDDNYFNRLFVGWGHTAARRAILRDLARADPDRAPRWTPYLEVGYYLQEFFGIFDEVALNKGNDWWWDAHLNLGVTLTRTAGALFRAGLDADVLLDRDGRSVLRLRPGLETLLLRTGVPVAFGLRWHAVDDHPRDSRRQMIEIDARFAL